MITRCHARHISHKCAENIIAGGPRDRHMILFKSMLRLVGLWQAFVELHVAAVGHLNIMVTAAVTCDRSGQLL